MTDAPKETNDRTLSAALAGHLRQAIIGGRFQPGARLRLDELRSEFGVSLSPLREALMGLTAERLVDVEAQRGFRVPPVSETALKEITTLRMDFECMALRAAIEQGDLNWESAIAGTLHRLMRTGRAPSGEGLQEWESAHRAFHMSVLSACNMPLLLNFCSVLHDHSDRYRRMFLKTHAGDRDVPGEHARIAELTMARETDDACALLRQHIGRTGENVRIALTAEPPQQSPPARASTRGRGGLSQPT
jgi:GntR family transcriptional regulator, carbon starvation induced regulator